MQAMIHKFSNSSEFYDRSPYAGIDLFPHYQSPDNAASLCFTSSLVYCGVLLLGDEEQVKSFGGDAISHRLASAYAQTEYAHGSDVQGLLTEAHFNKEKKCFVLTILDEESIKYVKGFLE
jgi:hypothetical protein